MLNRLPGLVGRSSLNIVRTLSLQQILEKATIEATAATGTVNYDALTQAVWYFTTDAAANWTLNIRGNSGASLNGVMKIGKALTLAHLVKQGATPYYNNVVTIDGGANTPKWQSAAPIVGNASGVDVYVYSVLKTADATFTVFASQTPFV